MQSEEEEIPGYPRKSSDVFRRLEAERMSQSAWNLDRYLESRYPNLKFEPSLFKFD